MNLLELATAERAVRAHENTVSHGWPALLNRPLPSSLRAEWERRQRQDAERLPALKADLARRRVRWNAGAAIPGFFLHSTVLSRKAAP